MIDVSHCTASGSSRQCGRRLDRGRPYPGFIGRGRGAQSLEDAYWGFEGGTDGAMVPAGENTIEDVTPNANDMQRYQNDINAPHYSSQVPLSYVPATGQPNALSLRFAPHTGGGDDIYAAGKNINNRLIGGTYKGNPNPVTAFTLEASFRPNVIGSRYMTVICRESRLGDNPDTTSDHPPLALKIMAADAPFTRTRYASNCGTGPTWSTPLRVWSRSSRADGTTRRWWRPFPG